MERVVAGAWGGALLPEYVFVDVLETFRAQRDGHLSFTDAAIVTLARTRDARFVATFDRDFRQVEGLTVVPA